MSVWIRRIRLLEFLQKCLCVESWHEELDYWSSCKNVYVWNLDMCDCDCVKACKN